jgi:hypothetical protein
MALSGHWGLPATEGSQAGETLAAPYLKRQAGQAGAGCSQTHAPASASLPRLLPRRQPPASSRRATDARAADAYVQFQIGWMADPIFFGALARGMGRSLRAWGRASDAGPARRRRRRPGHRCSAMHRARARQPGDASLVPRAGPLLPCLSRCPSVTPRRLPEADAGHPEVPPKVHR